MSRMKRLLGILAIVLIILLPESIDAQCAMCKATAEGAAAEGSKAAAGINTGVLYLLVFPFLLAGVFYYLFKKRQAEIKELD